MSMKVMRIVLLLLISALPALSQSSSYPHLEFGIPKDSDSTDDYIIERPQYALSYNEHLGCPNWVSWNLESKYFGDVDRYKGKFITDTSLPTKYYHVKDDDYKNSGFDRGHIVRSEERTATIADNKATFILSNIVPQTHDLNAGPWLKLEYHCQKLSVDSTKE
ncbi:MAG: endonuclease mitochondrial, partial [Bacteroidota bacterium]|nr:endonuclease mitochondrial [Bacteroidota bacterium]